MDEELKTFLITVLDQNRDQLKTEIQEQIRASEARMDARMDVKLENLETNMLKEFWKWGRNAEQRIRRVEASDATTTERIASLEDRVFTLERRIAGGRE